MNLQLLLDDSFFFNLPVVSSKANLLWPVKCLLYTHHFYYILARHLGDLQIKFFLIQRLPLLKGLLLEFLIWGLLLELVGDR